MKDVADRSRANVGALIKETLVGGSLQKVTYAVTYWELVFLAPNDVRVVASEILLPGQKISEEETKQAVEVGSYLLALTNMSRVASVAVHANGDLVLTFLKGESIRLLAEVSGADWTWSIEAPEFRFTCDGPIDD